MNKSCYSNKWEKTVTQKLTKKDVCQQKRLCVNKNGCVSTKKDVCLVNLYIYCYHLQIQSVEPTTCNMGIVNVWINVNHIYLLNTIELSLIVMSIQPVSTLSKAIKGKPLKLIKMAA